MRERLAAEALQMAEQLEAAERAMRSDIEAQREAATEAAASAAAAARSEGSAVAAALNEQLRAERGRAEQAEASQSAAVAQAAAAGRRAEELQEALREAGKQLAKQQADAASLSNTKDALLAKMEEAAEVDQQKIDNLEVAFTRARMSGMQAGAAAAAREKALAADLAEAREQAAAAAAAAQAATEQQEELLRAKQDLQEAMARLRELEAVQHHAAMEASSLVASVTAELSKVEGELLTHKEQATRQHSALAAELAEVHASAAKGLASAREEMAAAVAAARSGLAAAQSSAADAMKKAAAKDSAWEARLAVARATHAQQAAMTRAAFEGALQASEKRSSESVAAARAEAERVAAKEAEARLAEHEAAVTAVAAERDELNAKAEGLEAALAQTRTAAKHALAEAAAKLAEAIRGREAATASAAMTEELAKEKEASEMKELVARHRAAEEQAASRLAEVEQGAASTAEEAEAVREELCRRCTTLLEELESAKALEAEARARAAEAGEEAALQLAKAREEAREGLASAQESAGCREADLQEALEAARRASDERVATVERGMERAMREASKRVAAAERRAEERVVAAEEDAEAARKEAAEKLVEAKEMRAEASVKLGMAEDARRAAEDAAEEAKLRGEAAMAAMAAADSVRRAAEAAMGEAEAVAAAARRRGSQAEADLAAADGRAVAEVERPEATASLLLARQRNEALVNDLQSELEDGSGEGPGNGRATQEAVPVASASPQLMRELSRSCAAVSGKPPTILAAPVEGSRPAGEVTDSGGGGLQLAGSLLLSHVPEEAAGPSDHVPPSQWPETSNTANLKPSGPSLLPYVPWEQAEPSAGGARVHGHGYLYQGGMAETPPASGAVDYQAGVAGRLSSAAGGGHLLPRPAGLPEYRPHAPEDREGGGGLFPVAQQPSTPWYGDLAGRLSPEETRGLASAGGVQVHHAVEGALNGNGALAEPDMDNGSIGARPPRVGSSDSSPQYRPGNSGAEGSLKGAAASHSSPYYPSTYEDSGQAFVMAHPAPAAACSPPAAAPRAQDAAAAVAGHGLAPALQLHTPEAPAAATPASPSVAGGTDVPQTVSAPSPSATEPYNPYRMRGSPASSPSVAPFSPRWQLSDRSPGSVQPHGCGGGNSGSLRAWCLPAQGAGALPPPIALAGNSHLQQHTSPASGQAVAAWPLSTGNTAAVYNEQQAEGRHLPLWMMAADLQEAAASTATVGGSGYAYSSASGSPLCTPPAGPPWLGAAAAAGLAAAGQEASSRNGEPSGIHEEAMASPAGPGPALQLPPTLSSLSLGPREAPWTSAGRGSCEQHPSATTASPCPGHGSLVNLNQTTPPVPPEVRIDLSPSETSVAAQVLWLPSAPLCHLLSGGSPSGSAPPSEQREGNAAPGTRELFGGGYEAALSRYYDGCMELVQAPSPSGAAQQTLDTSSLCPSQVGRNQLQRLSRAPSLSGLSAGLAVNDDEVSELSDLSHVRSVANLCDTTALLAAELAGPQEALQGSARRLVERLREEKATGAELAAKLAEARAEADRLREELAGSQASVGALASRMADISVQADKAREKAEADASGAAQAHMKALAEAVSYWEGRMQEAESRARAWGKRARSLQAEVDFIRSEMLRSCEEARLQASAAGAVARPLGLLSPAEHLSTRGLMEESLPETGDKERISAPNHQLSELGLPVKLDLAESAVQVGLYRETGEASGRGSPVDIPPAAQAIRARAASTAEESDRLLRRMAALEQQLQHQSLHLRRDGHDSTMPGTRFEDVAVAGASAYVEPTPSRPPAGSRRLHSSGVMEAAAMASSSLPAANLAGGRCDSAEGEQAAGEGIGSLAELNAGLGGAGAVSRPWGGFGSPPSVALLDASSHDVATSGTDATQWLLSTSATDDPGFWASPRPPGPRSHWGTAEALGAAATVGAGRTLELAALPAQHSVAPLGGKAAAAAAAPPCLLEASGSGGNGLQSPVWAPCGPMAGMALLAGTSRVDRLDSRGTPAAMALGSGGGRYRYYAALETNVEEDATLNLLNRRIAEMERVLAGTGSDCSASGNLRLQGHAEAGMDEPWAEEESCSESSTGNSSPARGNSGAGSPSRGDERAIRGSLETSSQSVELLSPTTLALVKQYRTAQSSTSEELARARAVNREYAEYAKQSRHQQYETECLMQEMDSRRHEAELRVREAERRAQRMGQEIRELKTPRSQAGKEGSVPPAVSGGAGWEEQADSAGGSEADCAPAIDMGAPSEG